MNSLVIKILSIGLGIACVQWLSVLPHVTLVVGTTAILALVTVMLKYLIKYQTAKITDVISRVYPLVLMVCLFLCGFSYSIYMAQMRLSDELAQQHDDQIAILTVQVTSLVQRSIDTLSFDARVLQSNPDQGIPKQIRVRWSFGAFVGPYQARQVPNKPMPQIAPGQLWSFAALLRKPRATLNPGQRDFEGYWFAQGVRAMATVKGAAKRLEGEQWQAQEQLSFWLLGDWLIRIEQWRDQVRAHLQPYVANKRYGAVITALVMGDQAGIDQADWQLFNRAGLTHLVSISGSHITLLSALVVGLFWYGWRFLKNAGKPLADHRSGLYWAALAGLLTAFMYCCLAGWGVPAQRTFLMLLIALVSRLLGWQWPLLKNLLVSALAVLMLDPWAVLSTGFWLSFGAMLILALLVQAILKEQGWRAKVKRGIKSWLQSQLAVFIALAPILALLFQQISLISPIANSYAIFLIGTIVTPASLLLASLSFLPWSWSQIVCEYLSELIHSILFGTLELTRYLSEWSWALLDVPVGAWYVLPLALLAAGLLFVPRHLRWGRCLSLCMVPAVASIGWFPHQLIAPGFWQITAFDIGQGSALLIKTRHHAILFDTGPRLSRDNEAATRTLLPSLRQMGVKPLDVVIISHSDLDHAGGFSKLIHAWPVRHLYAPFRLDHWLEKESQLLGKSYMPIQADLRFDACRQAEGFTVDGVTFRFLWPSQQALSDQSADHVSQVAGSYALHKTGQVLVSRVDKETVAASTLKDKAGNALSCVLSVEGVQHKALLTGDIGVAQEKQLIAHIPAGEDFRYDVVVAPHHGSRTSSSNALIQQTKATWAIIQSGAYNRFGHPNRQVVQRWQQAGTRVLNTADLGSLWFESSPTGLRLKAQKYQRQRYWHHLPPM